MNPSQIVLKLVLDELHQPLKLANFDDRFMIQKKIYLTQLTGLDLFYRFGWYIRGPYSRELTGDAFALKEQMDRGDDEHEHQKLGRDAAKLAETARSFWENCPKGISKSDWVELLASLHYLKHIAWWPKGTQTYFECIYRGLVENKPRFKGRKSDARAAWDHLNEVGLIRHKVLRAL